METKPCLSSGPGFLRTCLQSGFLHQETTPQGMGETLALDNSSQDEETLSDPNTASQNYVQNLSWSHLFI